MVEKGKNLLIIGYVVLAFSIPFFIISVYLSFNLTPVLRKTTIQSKIYHQKERNWKLRTTLPPAPNLSKVSKSKSLYVMILDDEYEAKPHQCLMKKQWVDEFLKRGEVDGVEVYSTNYWINKECNLSSITINKMPEQKINPSAFLLYNSLKLFLERSDAGWLFIISDAAYIRTKRFFSFFNQKISNIDPERETFMIGCCVEERYFFQMLLISSGIIISRNFAKRIVNTGDDQLWNVSYTVGITAEEILAKISDKNGVYIPGKQTHEMIGRGFAYKEMYEMLKKKEFGSLKPCDIPVEFLRPQPGELGLCDAQLHQVDDMSVWAGTRFMSKYEFLKDAEEMIGGLPSNLYYYWERLYPTLCIK